MGEATNGVTCRECKTEFAIVIEWLSKKDALKTIEMTRCPNCDSEDWYFTDEMGQ